MVGVNVDLDVDPDVAAVSHPGVAGEGSVRRGRDQDVALQVAPLPVVAEAVEREVGLAELGDIGGDDEGVDRLQVGGARRADGVLQNA